MQELEPTKGKRITIPKRVKRYCVAYYTKSGGWLNSFSFHTTPEGALEDFLRMANNQNGIYKPSFYTVYEIELEIPVHE